MHKIFEIIKASKFFPQYVPEVKNWKHKIRGIDGNNKPIQFSDAEKEKIKKGINNLFEKLKDCE